MKPLLDYIMNCDNYFYKMTRLDKLIESNKIQKLNRRNRLEDKLKQQEYYGEIEELFDPPFNKAVSLSESLSHYQVERVSCLN